MKIKIFISADCEWSKMFFNNELVYENHDITILDLDRELRKRNIELLNLDVCYINLEGEDFERLKELKEIEFYRIERV